MNDSLAYFLLKLKLNIKKERPVDSVAWPSETETIRTVWDFSAL